MGVLAVDLAFVRDVLLPGLTLTPGRAMMARVVSADEGAGGTLTIAGYLLDAELPSELAAGESLRLVVRDVDAERVLLAVAPHDGPPTPPPPVPIVALPGGGELRVLSDDEQDDGARGGPGGSRGGGGHRLGLRLELPALGTLELRFALDPATLRASVAVDPGEPLTQARSGAAQLRDALAEAAQRPASLSVTARRQELDVYA